MANQDSNASLGGTLSGYANFYNNTDSLAQASGSLLSTIVYSQFQDSTISVNGTLTSTADSVEANGASLIAVGTLNGTADAKMISNASVSMNGTLSSTNKTIMYNDAYAACYGFLSSGVFGLVNLRLCENMIINMKIQVLESAGCKIGESMDITRHRGDTYPLIAKLGRNGNYNAAGITFKMSTKIADGTVYTSIGTVTDVANGIVTFPFEVDAVVVSGEGRYDIQGEDGYKYTYDSGKFTLLPDLTV